MGCGCWFLDGVWVLVSTERWLRGGTFQPKLDLPIFPAPCMGSSAAFTGPLRTLEGTKILGGSRQGPVLPAGRVTRG